MSDPFLPPSFTPRGAWNNLTVYDPGDIVNHNGASYLAVQSSVNDPPPSPSWQTLVAPALSFNLRGEWSSATPYEYLDVVTYQGEAWVCREANINRTPKEGRYWQQLMRIRTTSGVGIGYTGDPGPQGPQGDPGPVQVYVQETNPGLTGQGIWVELFPDGTPKTVWVETGL